MKFLQLLDDGRLVRGAKNGGLPGDADLPPIWVVAGCSGSGKTWICQQLAALGWCYVPYDKTPKEEFRARLAEGLKTHPLTTVFDPTVHVSTWMKELSDQFTFKLVVIQEPYEVVAARLVARGGKVTPTLLKRMKRMTVLAKDSYFTGTSVECFALMQASANFAKSEQVTSKKLLSAEEAAKLIAKRFGTGLAVLAD